ncbi:hypothetical protein RB195_019301 [Necator americanus]|uniref:Uncharacterized protein n=1 Tax=Necator americanus TaxID=51031 RepID=A0ABR1CG43_NECAM
MLDTREGERAVHRLVRARHRSTLDMERTRSSGADGAVLRRSGQILERWRGTTITCATKSSVILPSQPFPASRVLFYQLLPSVSAALAKMKSNKATGPDDIPVDIWLLGDRGSMWLATLFNKIVAEGRTPDVWQTSVTVPVWKGRRHATAPRTGLYDCSAIR